MNRIKVKDSELKDNILLTEDKVLNYSNKKGNLDIKIDKKIKLFIYLENCNLNIDFDINSNTVINIFTFNTNLNIDLNLNKSNIKLDYIYSTLNKDSNTYTLNINHNEKNIISNVINHGINLESEKLEFIVNAIVPKTITGIITKQDNKILLMKDNNSVIKPNLLIDNNDIEASHSAYLGDFKKEVIFYLKTRGITFDQARKMLAKSFLLGNMKISYEEINLILTKLDKYWR